MENGWFSESEVMWPGQKFSLKVKPEGILFQGKVSLRAPTRGDQSTTEGGEPGSVGLFERCCRYRHLHGPPPTS